MNPTENRQWAWISVFGWILFLTLHLYGIFRAISFGGGDFDGFCQAGRWVVEGQPSRIYTGSPQFFYTPGFAWLFSFWAMLPRVWSLLLFSVLKMILGLHVLWLLHQFMQGTRFLLWGGVLAWGFVLGGRPVLIDLEFGQINWILVWISIWAGLLVLEENSRRPAWKTIVVGVVWSTFAVAKLIPLPLALFAFGAAVSRLRQTRGRLTERLTHLKNLLVGSLVGGLGFIVLPFFFVSLSEGMDIYRSWLQSLLSLNRGFPVGFHNQSWFAFVVRWFTDGLGWFDSVILRAQAGKVLVGSSLVVSGLLFFLGQKTQGIIRRKELREARIDQAMALGIAGVLVLFALHVVWKAYFVWAIPLSVVLVEKFRVCFSGSVLGQASAPVQEQISISRRTVTAALVCVLISSLAISPVIGERAAAACQSLSLMLWMSGVSSIFAYRLLSVRDHRG